jgi:cytochrome c-type biogenesis protein
MDVAPVPLGLAFLAGVVSFLSPCVLPIVPGYVTFVTGMTLEEMEADRSRARAQAAIHSGLFVLGFSLVFIALGATATALGAYLRQSLPLLQQIGGIVIIIFGLYMLGLLRIPALMRERRFHLASKPVGKVGSVVAGLAFGAGWTPCIGPILAAILMYAGLEGNVARGMLMLAVYALGLGIPFFIAAVGLNWFLAGAPKIRRWIGPLEKASGVVLVALGVLLFTGRFTMLSAYLARYGTFIDFGL